MILVCFYWSLLLVFQFWQVFFYMYVWGYSIMRGSLEGNIDYSKNRQNARSMGVPKKSKVGVRNKSFPKNPHALKPAYSQKTSVKIGKIKFLFLEASDIHISHNINSPNPPLTENRKVAKTPFFSKVWFTALKKLSLLFSSLSCLGLVFASTPFSTHFLEVAVFLLVYKI